MKQNIKKQHNYIRTYYSC